MSYLHELPKASQAVTFAHPRPPNGPSRSRLTHSCENTSRSGCRGSRLIGRYSWLSHDRTNRGMLCGILIERPRVALRLVSIRAPPESAIRRLTQDGDWQTGRLAQKCAASQSRPPEVVRLQSQICRTALPAVRVPTARKGRLHRITASCTPIRTFEADTKLPVNGGKSPPVAGGLGWGFVTCQENTSPRFEMVTRCGAGCARHPW